MTGPAHSYFRTDDATAPRLARVSAFFSKACAEYPDVAKTLTVVATTPENTHFIMRPQNDALINCATALQMRSNKSAYVQSRRICIYVGPDNTYEPMGSSIEMVLAHELGHWMDGADGRFMDIDTDEPQRAECVADVFAGLLYLRESPADRGGISREFRRVLCTSHGQPQRAHYTLPALLRLLQQTDGHDLTDKTLQDLTALARGITADTYRRRGQKAVPS